MYPYNLQVPHFSPLLHCLSYVLEGIQANHQPAFVGSDVIRLWRKCNANSGHKNETWHFALRLSFELPCYLGMRL
jgi:hypothetical protein